jgi:hypothetical protein
MFLFLEKHLQLMHRTTLHTMEATSRLTTTANKKHTRYGDVATIIVLCTITFTVIFSDRCFGFAPEYIRQHRSNRIGAFSTLNTMPPKRKSLDNNNLQKFAPPQSFVIRRTTDGTAVFGMWSQNDEIEGSDRIKACVPYLLPLIDGDHFGQFIYERIPIMGSIDQLTIGPLAELGHSIPFLSLGLFIALTLGTRFNTEMSRNLRFSAQQAALIDVALLFPELISSGFAEDPLPRYIAEPCCNFVWYAYMSIVIYCIFSNLRGKKPDQIPYLSYSADIMVGPF